jgi:hypothetical protein
MNYRSSLPSLNTFSHRYQIRLFLGLITLVGVYLILPLGVSYLLAQGLSRHGYEKVIVQLGYPGLWGMDVPVISLQQNLGGESLLISLTNAEVHYRLPQLLRGHVDRVSLPDVSIQVLNTLPPGADDADDAVQSPIGESPWSLLTAGDLLHRLPILPFDELQLDRVTIFREKATGPLRKVTVSGALTHQDGELGGHLSFQGRDTASYGLTVTGNSASTWSATLVSQRLQAVPIVSWRSQAHPNGQAIEVNGQLDVNVRELAPFIALLVPIGPELGKVTGHVAVTWTGTTATDAVLTSLWRDPRTHLEGQVQARITLPALKGVAKDVAVAYEGAFTGNAMQVGWTLAPGVPLVATVNSQAPLFPEAVRKILPRGDQPVRIENAEPVQGILYWDESPARMIVDGPLHVTYGKTPGPLMAALETSHAEWAGNELLSAEGAYRIAGVFPKAITDLLSAHEASAELRGTLVLTRAHVQGVVLPSSSMTVRQIDRGTAFIPSVTLQLTEALPLQCDLAIVHCSAGPATVAVRMPTLRVMGREIHVAQGALTLQLAESAGDSWHTQGKLAMRGVSMNLASWGIAPMDWKIRFLANQTGIKTDLRIDTPFQENLASAQIDQPLSAGEGVLHGTIGPIDFDGNEHRLSKLVTGLPLPIEITDGRLESTVDASWSGGIGDLAHRFELTSGTAMVAVNKLSGRYDEYAVRELSTIVSLRAQGLESVATVEPASVTLASVQTGVEVTNISAMVQGAWTFANLLPVIKIKDFQCEAFGGMVTSAGLVADFAKPPFHMTFSLQDLDLAKILSVEKNQGLQGTGLLNGTLPVSIAPEGITIKDGTITAIPSGGVIRYGSARESPKTISETSTHLHLVTQALNNFHYTLLRVGVDYAESGMLFLTARLEGRNPDLKTIPPINFNLTVQEHIPTLLKSLRLVENLEKAVEGKYRRP